MRILVIADLHLDLWDHARRDPFGPLLPIFQTLDAIIIAGDLANDPMRNWPGALERIGQLIEPSKVWVMPGNHDYYGWNLAGDDGLRALAERAGMHFAQKASVEFGGVRFLCCTLWTDFSLHAEPHVSKVTAQRAMNDYFQIARDANGSDLVLPDDVVRKHKEQLVWLASALDKAFEGRTVVVTHHCPSPAALGTDNRLAPAFCTDLSSLTVTRRVDLWLFGHTHRHLSAVPVRTPVVNVSLGYPREVDDSDIVDVVLRGIVDTDLPGFFAYPELL
ncbi:metallophosphoesterase [Rhodobacter sp. 24-YEA-8]|uniref:metallophosphoesterase n=1 Tax=Rhodobacter sp. 24-YEA-8 TaxID=1884310 RepID=UPI00089C405B|nr:metallophosphoesterase [Rhodobacter sp. 24-YEA-8]SED17464.1 Calcineurin-like phosphoesterase [Rhodobacter sp. 24-YEA-8]